MKRAENSSQSVAPVNVHNVSFVSELFTQVDHGHVEVAVNADLRTCFEIQSLSLGFWEFSLVVQSFIVFFTIFKFSCKERLEKTRVRFR